MVRGVHRVLRPSSPRGYSLRAAHVRPLLAGPYQATNPDDLAQTAFAELAERVALPKALAAAIEANGFQALPV
jgi:hypothetical protein